MFKLKIWSADWKDEAGQEDNEIAAGEAEANGYPFTIQFGNSACDEYVVIATDCPDLSEAILGSGSLEDEGFGHDIITVANDDGEVSFESVEALRKAVAEFED